MANYVDTLAVSSRWGAIEPDFSRGGLPHQSKDRGIFPGNEPLDLVREHPFENAALRSRRMFEEKRCLSLDKEGDARDYTIVASETIVMPTPENAAERSYVGAVTFGRKNGKGMTTILSYADLGTDASVQAGYIEVGLDSQNRKTYTKKPVMRMGGQEKTDLETAQQYASGLTEEVLDLAEKVGKFEHEIEPVMQRAVSEHPFNTISFYSKGGGERSGFYSHIANPQNGYFRDNGGNCVLFTLHMGDELMRRGFPLQVAYIPPSEVLPSGHTAVIAASRDNSLSFFVDPGLSLTQPIPLSSQIPLYPFAFEGNKEILTSRDASGVPHLRIHTKKAKSDIIIENPIAYDDFLAKAPKILEEMDASRTHAKLDYHAADGASIFSCTVNLRTGTVSVKSGAATFKDIPIGQFIHDTLIHDGLAPYLERFNISLDYLLGELSGFGNTAA